MQSHNNIEEMNAIREAQSLLQSNPKEGPVLLEAVINEHRKAGRLACALDVRRVQCFGYIANLQYSDALDRLNLLTLEAENLGQVRFVGLAEMYRGVIAIECDRGHAAIDHFGNAIQIATELQDLDLLCRVQTNLAYAQSRQERFEEALETLKLCFRQSDLDDVTVSNATIYFNIASTTIHLAFQERLQNKLTPERLEAARTAVESARQNCTGDAHLNLLTEVISSVYVGLVDDPRRALEQLEALASRIELSSGAHHNTFMVAKCQLLELADMWVELCQASNDFLEDMNRTNSFAFRQAMLRQSARAHANLGDFETAYNYLAQSTVTPTSDQGTGSFERSRLLSLQQDLEKQKFDQDVLRMRNKTLIERNKILELEARYDPLSGLLNRRGTEEALQQFTQRHFATRFVIALLDIDHFKRINDQFGHAIGDQVIHEFSNCLANSATAPAKIGRWGGEEFLIVFDVHDEAEMEAIGRTLVQEIRTLNWDHIHQGMRVTASVGLSMWCKGDSLDNAVRIADDMLYEVKHHGRDNWRVWTLDQAA